MTYYRVCLLLTAVLLAHTGLAQQRLNLFTDCECNKTLLKQELNYVNHTIDPAGAQVNLFIVTNYLSSGGRVYDLQFKGQQELAGNDIRFKVNTTPVMTSLERDQYLTKRIELGLAGFLAGTDYADLVDLTAQAPPEPEEEAEEEEAEENQDNWNSWIFELSANYNGDVESRRSRNEYRISFDADRTTPEWRLRGNTGLDNEIVKNTRDGKQTTSILRRQWITGSVVKSLSNHWSVGVFGSLHHNTRDNIDDGIRLSPAIEYNIFDYNEVPFKEFTVAYRAGWLYNNYIDTTTFLLTSEHRPRHSVDIDLRLRQRWGSVFAGISGVSFLDNIKQNRVSMSLRANVRVFKGLSFNTWIRYEIINDQIFLPLEEADSEAAILGLAALPTSYRFRPRFGLSYTFGSLFNNVINTRL